MRRFKRLLVLTALALAAASVARAQTATIETWVEPELTDCSSTQQVIHPESWSFAGSADRLDNDGNEGAAETNTPDNTDAIWGTIRDAVTWTSAGGVVHVPARGVYRDGTTVTISDSVTVRGFSDTDVVVSAECGTPTPPSAAFTISIGSGETAILENLTIRGYTKAIDATGSTGGTIVLRNCTLDDNTTGIDLTVTSGVDVRVVDSRIRSGTIGIIPAESASLEVVRSEIIDNSTGGIVGSNGAWTVTDSRIARNGDGINKTTGVGGSILRVSGSRIQDNDDDGIAIIETGFQLAVHDSVITGNGDDGLFLQGTEGARFRIVDTIIEGNLGDGVYAENSSTTCVDPTSSSAMKGTLMRCMVAGNGGDGLDIGGNGTCSGGPPTPVPSRVFVGLVHDSIASNGAWGLTSRTTSSTFHCGVGENQVTYNTSGNQNPTAFCTVSTANANQAN